MRNFSKTNRLAFALVSAVIMSFTAMKTHAEVALEVSGSGGYGLSQSVGPFGRTFLPGGITGDAHGPKVMFTGSNSLSLPLGPIYGNQSFDWAAIVFGDGQASYGQLTGQMAIDLKAGPDMVKQGSPPHPSFAEEVLNGGHAEGFGNVMLTFKDSGVVTAPNLAPGTPVTLQFVVVNRTFGIFFGRPMGLDSNGNSNQASGNGYLQIFDQGTQTSLSPSYAGGVTVYTLNTAVGNRIQLQNTYTVSAAGLAGRDGGASTLTPFYTQAVATVKGNSQLFISGQGGVGLVADSGHAYGYVQKSAAVAPTSIAQSAITPLPGGIGVFSAFNGKVSLSGSGTAFLAFGTGGQEGIYAGTAGILSAVADKTTAIPNGTGLFTSFVHAGFPTDPMRSGDNIVFAGMGASNQQGIYARLGGTLSRIADKSTAIPGGAGNFTAFSAAGVPASPAISGSQVVFTAFGLSQAGVYLHNGSLTKVADMTTDIPGGVGTFTSFALPDTNTLPVISGNTIVFFGGGGNGQQGIYRLVSNGAPQKLVDTQTLMPGTTTPFSTFRTFAIDPDDPSNIAIAGGTKDGMGLYAIIGGGPLTKVIDGGTLFPGTNAGFGDISHVAVDPANIAFIGTSFEGDKGLFAVIDGALINLVSVGDTVEGKIVSGLELSQSGFSMQGGAHVAYRALYADGSSAVLTAAVPSAVPEPATLFVASLSALMMLRRRRWTGRGRGDGDVCYQARG